MTSENLTIQTDNSVANSHEESNISKYFTKLTKNKLHCTICEKIVSLRGSSNHFRMHSTAQPYSCPVCNKKFAHRSSVNRHKKSHEKTQFFQCSVCEKGFSNKSTFDIHLELHQGKSVAFPCSICDKYLESDSALKQHVQEHNELQFVQVTDSAGRSQLCLQTDYSLLTNLTKTTNNHTTKDTETADIVDLSRAFVTSASPDTGDNGDPLPKASSAIELYDDINEHIQRSPFQSTNGQNAKLYLSDIRSRGVERSTAEFGKLQQSDREREDIRKEPFTEEITYESEQPRSDDVSSNEIGIGEECLLRKMLASKIVGSVNAMSSKRALSSTVVRNLELDAKKYPTDVPRVALYTDRFQEQSKTVDSNDRAPSSQQVCSAEVKICSDEGPTISADLYSTGSDVSKLCPELTYISDIDLRNKIPHIRYFVNLKKQNIFYAQQEETGGICSKDSANTLSGAHILQNAQILQNAHLFQNVQELQNATILQNAQFLQSAHILQNAPTFVCVESSLVERRELPTAIEDKNVQIDNDIKAKTLAKDTQGNISELSEGFIVNDEASCPKLLMNCQGNAVIGVPEKSFKSDKDICKEKSHIPIYTDIPSKTPSLEACEHEDPYSFSLPGTPHEGTGSDVTSQSGAAATASLASGPKRVRKSAPTSAKRSRSDSGYKSFKCTSCDRFFPCSSALERHRQSKHPPHVVCHTCTICGKALYHPSHIYIHMRTHV